ncbi:MAG: DNA repair protein RadC [Euryarchaeota archaeon]|nr:DNA repair protein RadC [Euryarchaeota archaeon]
MRSIRDTRTEDRPREKLERSGAENLIDRELVAAIIGKGIPGRDVYRVADDIFREIKDKKNNLTFKDLTGIEGVGMTKACQILAAFELARRHLIIRDNGDIKISKPEDILPLVSDLIWKKQEYFICITLNGANEVIEKRIITKGLLNHSPIHPREIYADAITDRAASVIFIHNHPSGNPEPSRADIDITKNLIEAGEILGIHVLDHLIVAKRGHVSLKNLGLI